MLYAKDAIATMITVVNAMVLVILCPLSLLCVLPST
jgi:hypothetical protein